MVEFEQSHDASLNGEPAPHSSRIGRFSVVQSRSEDGQRGDQLLGGSQKVLGVGDRTARLLRGCGLARPDRVLEFVASTMHGSEDPEPVAELGAERHLDRVVPARRRRAQPLLSEQRGC